MVLIADRGPRYHYVVAVGKTADAVVIHDPAWGYGYGNHVVLRFPWSVLPDALRQEMTRQNVAGGYAYVYYAHLQRIDVSNGQAVTPDTVVGLLGNTGNSSGYHVHVELHVSMYADEHDVYSRLNLNPNLLYQL